MFNLLVLSLLSSSVLPVVLVSHFIAVCRSSFIRCHVWLLQPHKPLLVKRRLGSQRGRETLKDKDKTLSLSPFAFLIVAAYRFFILPWRPPFCHRATIPLSSSQSPANTMTTGWNVSCYLHRPQYSVCVCVCAHHSVFRHSSHHSRCGRCTPVSEGCKSQSHTSNDLSRHIRLPTNQRESTAVMYNNDIYYV